MNRDTQAKLIRAMLCYMEVLSVSYYARIGARNMLPRFQRRARKLGVIRKKP